MTTREKLLKRLTDSGMFEDQANQVLDIAIPEIEKMTPQYKITWDRPSDEYPDMIYNLFWLTLRKVALDWIDKNIPQAWFREMFV